MVKGKLERLSYQAVGQQLMVDTLNVEFSVDGVIHSHQLPNKGWSYENPSLQFFGYADLKPTDFDGTEYIFDEPVGCPVVIVENEYRLARKPFNVGKYFLKESDWFDPNGDMWNSGENEAFGGMNVEPSTGNRAAVDGEEE